MINDGKLVLLNGFNRLSGEKQAEILGMVKALTYVQLGEDKKALAFVNNVNKTQDMNGHLTRRIVRQGPCILA
ncbi:hypothetical protein AGMMS49579_06690 [Spirochaetia bacterium]|nr:hypothetical protein AGMMS49579_06690 [Spirochaetia bacterium]